jgi:hypothetical protein
LSCGCCCCCCCAACCAACRASSPPYPAPSKLALCRGRCCRHSCTGQAVRSHQVGVTRNCAALCMSVCGACVGSQTEKMRQRVEQIRTHNHREGCRQPHVVN